MNSTLPSTGLLKTKQHFEILDGLRGLAALVIVIFHFMEIIIPDFHDNIVAHGYLAVDFFFCLSGFVIAYAYDNRIEKIGIISFLKLRLIRLHPLVVIGAIIGLVVYVFDPFVSLSSHYSVGQNIWLFLSASLMIPYPIVEERFFNLFHLNPPTWSLFWEYVANIVYALILFRIRPKLLGLLTGIAGGLLCYAAYHYGNLSAGWGGHNYWGGGARIFFSFLAGMLVFRLGWIIKSPLGFKALGVLLLTALMFPFAESINWIVEPIIIIFYFPLLVALGAGAQMAASDKKLCVFSGEISYPLYMVHYPFIWLFFSYLEKYSPAFQEQVLIMCVGTPLLVGLAYLVMRYLDIPIRNYFKNKMKESAAMRQKA
ncbi:acyltransferase [Echinicola pacifica]|uniref:Acyltransferase n=1 Tax=Echinicola pacifica TaxID=346377 RepID=A0A918UJB3_9BACT|nr:acyltransferase [Echinicola pacifica]GGZ13873.1 acyltransferase [Echinicola pacifica]